MKTLMKVTTLSFLAAVMMMLTAQADEWQTNLPKAQTQAQKEKKLVLMDFTGSDWCGWCIKFDKEVFATKEFKAYASTNLVLVKLDFPRSTPQAANITAANNVLQEKYKVDGFPTLVVLNASGKEVGRQEGYKPGGEKAFIAWLEKMRP